MYAVTRYRVYPTRKQADAIFVQFRLCTEVKDRCLESGNFDERQLPHLKIEHPELKQVHSKVLQNLLFQLRNNIKGLSAVKKQGKRVWF